MSQSVGGAEECVDGSASALAIRRRATKLALLLTGFGTFPNLSVPQPLLPFFRDVFHTSELQASLTVSATVLAVALTAPPTGLLADPLGR